MSEKTNITPLGMKILIFLARNPNKEFYVREIAKSVKKSIGGTHSTLKSLHTMGFVIKKESGKNIYYRVNTENPSIKNFKIFMTTTELTPLVNELKKMAEKIVLFGSCATGDDTSDSDIDLLILTQEIQKVNDHLKKKILGRDIQAVVVNAAGLVKLKEKDRAFYHEVNKGIVMWDGRSYN